MLANIEKLPSLLYALPTETQQDVLSHLSSKPHLQALSTSSCHLHALVAEYLHSDITFDPLDNDNSLLSYLTHCAPSHGRLCKTLRLGFSLGPMISRAADLMRAQLFVRVLCSTRQSLQSLEINPAGTDLKNTSALLKALPAMHFPNLRELKLKIYDLEDDEVATMANFLNAMAKHASNFPELRKISLEGYWEASSSSSCSTSAIFKALQSFLSSLPRLSELRLAYLTISKQDLGSLLQSLALKKLELIELEPLAWQDCLEAVHDSPSQHSLTSLKLVLGDMTLSDRQLRKGVLLPSLRRLDIRMIHYSPCEMADEHLIKLYQTVCCSERLSLPALAVLSINDALSVRVDTCVKIATLIIEAKTNGRMANLRYVLMDADTPAGCRAAAASVLDPADIKLRDLPCKRANEQTSKVIYVNRGTIDTAISSGADEAALALAASMGAIVYPSIEI